MVKNDRITPGIAEMPASIIASIPTVTSSITLNQAATSWSQFIEIHILHIKTSTLKYTKDIDLQVKSSYQNGSMLQRQPAFECHLWPDSTSLHYLLQSKRQISFLKSATIKVAKIQETGQKKSFWSVYFKRLLRKTRLVPVNLPNWKLPRSQLNESSYQLLCSIQGISDVLCLQQLLLRTFQ